MKCKLANQRLKQHIVLSGNKVTLFDGHSNQNSNLVIVFITANTS